MDEKIKTLLVLLAINTPGQAQFNNTGSALAGCFLSKLSLCFYFPTRMSIWRWVSLHVAGCAPLSQPQRNIRSYLNAVLALPLI